MAITAQFTETMIACVIVHFHEEVDVDVHVHVHLFIFMFGYVNVVGDYEFAQYHYTFTTDVY